MASYYIFCDISTIAGRILMVWKAKLVFGLLKWYNLTRYQSQFTKPKFTDQLYQTKSTGSNCFLWKQTKFIQSTLPNQIYQTKSTKWNLPSKIYQLKSFSIKPKKTNQLNQFYQTKSMENCLDLSWLIIPTWLHQSLQNQIYQTKSI